MAGLASAVLGFLQMLIASSLNIVYGGLVEPSSRTLATGVCFAILAGLGTILALRTGRKAAPTVHLEATHHHRCPHPSPRRPSRSTRRPHPPRRDRRQRRTSAALEGRDSRSNQRAPTCPNHSGVPYLRRPRHRSRLLFRAGFRWCSVPQPVPCSGLRYWPYYSLPNALPRGSARSPRAADHCQTCVIVLNARL